MTEVTDEDNESPTEDAIRDVLALLPASLLLNSVSSNELGHSPQEWIVSSTYDCDDL